MLRPCVFGGLWAVWCGFIFFNSFKTGVASAVASDSIAGKVASLLNTLGLKMDMDTLITIIRKTAHFTEFFIMGLLICLCFYYGASRFLPHAGTMLFICLSVGVIDEFIQSFITGRSSEVRDVLIDFGGALLAFLLVLLISKRKKPYRKYNKKHF